MSEYQSNYTGQNIDAAVAKIVDFDTRGAGFVYLDTTIANPANLNELLEPKGYVINNYINGVDGVENTRSPIVVFVSNLTSDVIIQSYMVNDKLYSRTYIISTTTFSAWGVDNTHYLANADAIFTSLAAAPTLKNMTYFTNPETPTAIEFDTADVVVVETP
jgi:hypothetical protein